MARNFDLALLLFAISANLLTATDETCALTGRECEETKSSVLMQSRMAAKKMKTQLQTESQVAQGLDFSSIQLDPIAVEKRIAALVNDHVKNGKTISKMDMSLITEVILLLEEKVKPSILSAHSAEETNVNLRWGEIKACIDDLKELEATTLKNSEHLQAVQHIELAKCQARLDTEKAEKDDACGDFRTFLDRMHGSPEPVGWSTCPFPPPDSMSLKEWLAENTQWFNESTKLYIAKDEECKEETGDFEDQTIRCAAESHIAATYQCEFCDDVGTTNEAYNKCYSTAVAQYEETKEQVTETVASRKLEWEAAERAKCYLNVLNMPDGGAEEDATRKAEEAMANCRALLIDTSRFTITFQIAPPLEDPAFEECSVAIIEANQCTQMQLIGGGPDVNKQWWKDDNWKQLTLEPTPAPTPPPSQELATQAPDQWLNLNGFTALQSSTVGTTAGPQLAIDSISNPDFSAGSCTHTTAEKNVDGVAVSPWWEVDLGTYTEVRQVQVTNRGDCCGWRLSPFKVTLSGYEGDSVCAENVTIMQGETKDVNCKGEAKGTKLKITQSDPGKLTLCEVKVYGKESEPPTTTPPPVLPQKAEAPIYTLVNDNYMCDIEDVSDLKMKRMLDTTLEECKNKCRLSGDTESEGEKIGRFTCKYFNYNPTQGICDLLDSCNAPILKPNSAWSYYKENSQILAKCSSSFNSNWCGNSKRPTTDPEATCGQVGYCNDEEDSPRCCEGVDGLPCQGNYNEEWCRNAGMEFAFNMRCLKQEGCDRTDDLKYCCTPKAPTV